MQTLHSPLRNSQACTSLSVEQSKTTPSSSLLHSYGMGDFAVSCRCSRPCKLLLWDFCSFSLMYFKVTEDYVSESILCFCPVDNFHSSTFLGEFCASFGKRRTFPVLWDVFHALVLCLERGTSAFTWGDHVMPGDLRNLCNNCTAWPHRPSEVHKPQLGNIAHGCSCGELPRKEIKCG